MGNVTMRDIGKRVGVSAVTVSKALAGKSGVGDEMRQKIIRIAKELGYVNPNAASGQPARSLDVGILIPDRFFSIDSFYAMFYKILVQTLTDAGHFGMLELLPSEAETALQVPNIVRSDKVDALIILGQPSRAYARMIAEQSIPVVFLDFYDEQAEADAVVGDNTYGCYRLTNHLIKNGHRNIGFVGSRRSTSSIMDRYLGFYRALISNDLPVREKWIYKDRDEQGHFLPLDFSGEMPTALVCNCDVVARWTIDQLKAQGYRVPQDVSVVGFDDFPAQAVEPALSTFRMDVPTMARMAVKLVADRCNGEKKASSRVVVGGQPVYRDSDIAYSAE